MDIFTQVWLDLSEKNPIEDFLDKCEALKLGYTPRYPRVPLAVFPSEGIFCRGEPEIFEESFLTPKIFRKTYRQYEEAELISEFKATFPEHEKRLSSEIDWLSLMQHNGVPTRLLDWSSNPLIALYFALGQEDEFEEDGAVYIAPIYNRFNIYFSDYLHQFDIPIRLMSRTYAEYYAKLAAVGLFEEIATLKSENIPRAFREKGARLDIDKKNIAIKKVYLPNTNNTEENLTEKLYLDAVEVFPPNSHPRIRAQSGRFTINYGKYLNNRQILCDAIKHESSHFVKNSYRIRIPGTIKEQLKKKLSLMNITELSLFRQEDKFFNYFREKKFQPIMVHVTGNCSSIEAKFTLQVIEEILLSFKDNCVNLELCNAPINKIVKVFKILGMKTIIQQVFKNFLAEFIKTNLIQNNKTSISYFSFIFPKIYNALDKFSRESKSNNKLVLEQLGLLEWETSESSLNLLSKTIEIIQKKGLCQMPDLNFDIENNLFEKAIKKAKRNQVISENKKTETVQ